MSEDCELKIKCGVCVNIAVTLGIIVLSIFISVTWHNEGDHPALFLAKIFTTMFMIIFLIYLYAQVESLRRDSERKIYIEQNKINDVVIIKSVTVE